MSQFKNLEEATVVRLDAHLGYDYYKRPEEKDANYRNGKRKKTVKTTSGTLDIEVPVDKNGSFEPHDHIDWFNFDED